MINKNVKKIIAIAMAVGTISAFAPATHGNFLTTKAFASSDDDNDKTTLDSLKVKTSDGTIKLYKDDDYDSDDKVDSEDIDENDDYYGKTSSRKITIDTDGPSTKYIRVFKGERDSAKGKSVSDDIELSSGTNLITVRVYDEKPGSDVRYDDSYESQYKLHIKCTGSGSDEDSSSANSDSYLETLSVADHDISLSDSKTEYSYAVGHDDDEVYIKAEPKDSDDEVTINDDSFNSNDERRVSLGVGDNIFKIKVKDDDDSDKVRTYKLTITRPGTTTAATNTAATNTNTANTVNTNTASTVKVNQWVDLGGGKWQYNDSLGHPFTNQWYFDRNLGKWYYLGADGNMQTGWILVNGKYYFLYDNGSMASDTTIGQYKVGSDGAWIR